MDRHEVNLFWDKGQLCNYYLLQTSSNIIMHKGNKNDNDENFNIKFNLILISEKANVLKYNLARSYHNNDII